MIYLLRHAESVPSPDVEEPNWPLSDQGRAQAESLVPVLSACGVDVIYSSPYTRAVETVRPFVEQSDLNIRTHNGLRERRLTTRFLNDVETRARKTWADFSWSMPDGESNAVAQQRFVSTITSLLQTHPDETVLISTHGTVTALFLNAINPEVGVQTWAGLGRPDLIRVERPVLPALAGVRHKHQPVEWEHVEF